MPRNSEARIRAILDSAIDAIITVGPNGRIVEFNPAAQRTFGYRHEEVIGREAVETLVPPRFQKDIRRELERYLRTGESPIVGNYVELPGVRADGREFPAEVAVTVTSLNGVERVVTVFVRDITDRVNAESLLQKQLDERQAVYELSEAIGRAVSQEEVNDIAIDALNNVLGTDRAAVLLADTTGVMRFAAWRNLSDKYRVAVEGHSPWPVGATDPQPVVVSNLVEDRRFGTLTEQILAEGICAMGFIPLVYESRLLGKFMIYYDAPHEFSREELRLAQTIANHVAFAIDNRARRRATEEQREFLSQVLDLNPNLIFAKDKEGRFTLVNRTVAEIYGTTVDELIGKRDSDFSASPEEVEHFRRIDLEVMDSLRQHECEEIITDANGNVHWLHTVKRPIVGPDGRATHVVGVAVDITQRKRTEEELVRHRDHLEELVAERTRELERSHEQLRQSERMAMIGTLSTGLGHDMGNLLLPLRVRLDTMENRGLPAEFREDTRAIRTFAEYLQRLSNGLRLLALDPNEPGHSKDTTDLSDWWLDVQPVLKNALPSRIALEGELDENLPRVRMARHILTQVVFNLVQNAGEAMREMQGGRVTIWADAAGPDSLRIGVTDDGPGMVPEVARRCMEPFFTTKTRAISTGLGLALVHGLVQQSGAQISVATEEGAGTTFTLTIPSEPVSEGSSDAEGRRLRAVVSLEDPRSASHVVSVLRSLGFDVEQGEKPDDPTVDVWVAGGDARTLRLVREFASAGDQKHAIVLGHVPRGADYSRILELPEHPKPSEVWRAVRSIAERFQLEQKDSGA